MLKFGFSVAFMSICSIAATSTGEIATPTSSVAVGKYEVRNADRGATKRVKVFHDGSRIATLVLRRGNPTLFCCTADACTQVATLDACTTLKISCNADGWCSAR